MKMNNFKVVDPLPSQVKDLRGLVFGKLTVKGYLGRYVVKHSLWVCECECGDLCTATGNGLQRGANVSCGKKKHPTHITHGMTGTGAHKTWNTLRRRCLDPSFKQYKDYGGRGITFCDRWKDFKNFYEDMGDRPVGKTIDRIDVNGNYEPYNCKWSTHKEQCNNKRNSNGRT